MNEKRIDRLKFQPPSRIEQAPRALVRRVQLPIQTYRPVGRIGEISVLRDREESVKRQYSIGGDDLLDLLRRQ
jgi:hypothetical protein